MQIPAALKSVIAGIVSLHNFRKRPMYHLAHFSPTKRGALTSAGPEFTNSCFDGITGSPVTCNPLGPYDFATIYNVLPLWNAASPIDGTGQTIAIVARTNINVKDISDFQSLFGLPPNAPQIIVDGTDPGLVQGDETEADLDVEWSGAVAKGATIKLVVSESTETTDGVDLSALYIVDHNLASVMSESYGQCELNLGTAGNQFYSNLWQQAAAQGITAFVSSGDNGSAGCDFELAQGLLPPQPAKYGLQVNGIASTPYNVAVGGTDFNDYFNPTTYWNATNTSTTQASAKGYIPETTWNDSCTNALLEDPHFPLSTNAETNCNNPNISQFAVALGGSGGKSNCTAPTGTPASSCSGGYPKPLWQVATGVPNDGKRDLPDVSLFASNGFENSFYMMCEADVLNGNPCSTSNFVGVGGTSASSPAFAGLLALVNQKTGSRQGNANHAFYSLAAKQSSLNCNSSTGPASNCVFNDVTSGTIATPCVTGSLNCTTANASDQMGILSGYQAAAGYDQATGLGSVNANNLVNNWNSASGTASTTMLALNGGNAVNITHGTPVSVAVSVFPTSPKPTGLASLIATQGSNSFGIDTLTVSNGTASGTTNMLPGGSSYSVQAHYAGDSNYAGSDSSAVTVTVNPEPSVTNVRLATIDPTTGQVSNPNATSIPYGSIYVLRADVTNASGSTCFNSTSAALSYACSGGTVSFVLDGGSLGAGPVLLNSEGYAENQAVQLTGGPHTFTGNYSGDNSYLASSGTDNVTIVPASTLTYTHNLYPMPIGVPLVFSVGARTNDFGVFALPMSGTCGIFDGSTPLVISEYILTGVIYPGPNSPYVWETLDCETMVTFSGTPGPRVLTVKYSGDANYAPSTLTPVNIQAVYPTQTTLTPSASPIVDGQSLMVTAQIVPSQTASTSPTGTVTFIQSSVPIATVPVTNGQAQYTTPPLGAPGFSITGTYSGDSNYAASSGNVAVAVNPVPTTTSVTSSSPSVVQGKSVTFTAQITPARMGVAPLSQYAYVQFTANGAPLGTGQPISNNQAQVTTSFPTPGTIQIQATYSGTQDYTTSTGTFIETVVLSPDFTLSSSGTTTQAVNAGQTAAFTNVISVAAQNGFSAQVNLSCSLPVAATATTCSVNPTSFPNGSGTASVMVTTRARGVVLPLWPRVRFISRPQFLPIPLLMILISVLLLFFGRARRQRFAGTLPLAGLVLLILQAIGCGGGSSYMPPPPPPGTPAGTYTVTITAASGNTTHATTLTLIVN